MLTDREQMIEFLVTIVCGNVTRKIIAPKSAKLDAKQLIQLAQEYRDVNKLDIDVDSFADLIADVDHMLEKVTKILIHMIKDGYLFKDDLMK